MATWAPPPAETEREFSLRVTIDDLRRELGALIGKRPPLTIRACVYCGARCYGKACKEHRDLIQVDPSMGGTQS